MLKQFLLIYIEHLKDKSLLKTTIFKKEKNKII